MSVAERTRRAVRERPFLLDALAAGVVNYSAAARYLDVEGDEESVATALGRFAEELDAPGRDAGRTAVRLHRGLEVCTDGPSDAGESPVGLAVGDATLGDGGSLAAVTASGDVDPGSLEDVLARLRAEDVGVRAAGTVEGDLVVAVPSRSGADALRIVEDVL